MIDSTKVIKSNKMIERAIILKAIEESFIDDAKVFAFWLEGADARDVVDEYSDIDMWFDVDNGYEDMFIEYLIGTFDKIAPIEFFHEKNHPHPHIRQMFFRLTGTSKFMILDVCIQSHKREMFYTIGFEDEQVKLIFDKANVIKFEEFKQDEEIEYTRENNNQLAEIAKTFDFYTILITKEICRNNYLEALNYYNEYILKPMVKYFKIIHQPTKQDFYLKHIRRDLPGNIVKKLEYFHKISSIKDIELKTEEAISFLTGVIAQKIDRNR